MTFEEFMNFADRVIRQKTGFDTQDFADALWYDLYEELGCCATADDICETLAESDDIFARIYYGE